MKIYILFIVLIFFSCKPDNSVLRTSLSPQVLNDSIYTLMPGDLLVNDKYLVWTDPFGEEFFFHVVDKNTGKEIGIMGKIGLGPGEFVSPIADRFFYDNKVFITDVNRGVEGYLSIDSLLSGKESFCQLNLSEDIKHLKKIEDNIFIGESKDQSEKYFEIMIDGDKKNFGSYPIPEIKQHIGGYMAYDSNDKYLVYVSFKFPYIALYQLRNSNFELIWERKTIKNSYEIRNGEIEFNHKIMGQGDVCFSKDYIITLERDREYDDTDESTVGRDISKCPKTVFLYDFKSNLLKIVNLGIPVMRIAANRENNTLYVIGANPEYIIAKYEL